MSERRSRPRLVITGGASGIGAELVRALHSEWDTIVVDLSAPDELVEGVTYLRADVSAEAAVDEVRAALAPEADGLGALVHCAGIGEFGAFAQMPRSRWERTVRVNLEGTLSIVQGLAPLIADEGRVVLFSSGTAFKGPGGAAAYAASKAGVIGFARCLAEELGERSITVNVVAPGLVLTPLSSAIAGAEEATIATRAIKRAATTTDYVGPVRFFLSPGSSFVTGQTLVVDGGSIRH